MFSQLLKTLFFISLSSWALLSADANATHNTPVRCVNRADSTMPPAVAMTAAFKDDRAKFYQTIKDSTWSRDTGPDSIIKRKMDTNMISLWYENVADSLLAKNTNLPFADSLAKAALGYFIQGITHGVGESQMKMFVTFSQQGGMVGMLGGVAVGEYIKLSELNAALLMKEQKWGDAFTYLLKIKTLGVQDDQDSVLDKMYGDCLLHTGKYKEAQESLETAVKNGSASADIKEKLKEVYIKQKGNDKGFDAYYESLKEKATAKMIADIKAQMIDTATSVFELKDLDGKSVSLSDLKDKVVVLDFWATWCGPCNASLPGMQAVVNKFKNDKDVVFLFINTSEQTAGAERIKEIKDILNKNNYSFRVLLDEKTPDNSNYKVSKDYNITGIPMKFIIDKKGKTRFRVIGFDGDNNALENEITTMIGFAKKGE